MAWSASACSLVASAPFTAPQQVAGPVQSPDRALRPGGASAHVHGHADGASAGTASAVPGVTPVPAWNHPARTHGFLPRAEMRSTPGAAVLQFPHSLVGLVASAISAALGNSRPSGPRSAASALVHHPPARVLRLLPTAVHRTPHRAARVKPWQDHEPPNHRRPVDSTPQSHPALLLQVWDPSPTDDPWIQL